MDPISALGLAAAILQFVEFAAKVVRRLDSFGADLDRSPRVFRQIKVNLPLIADGLRRIQLQEESGRLDESTRAALRLVVAECYHSTAQLQAILDKIMPSATASSWERTAKALLSLGQDKKVEDISQSLDRYVQVLIFHQIIAGSTPQPVAPPPCARPSFWLVPFDRNASFVGRNDVLEQLDLSFTVREGSQPKAALYGLGGIGKSQIALEYCHRRQRLDSTCSVFWVNAATTSRFEESLKRIAQVCGLHVAAGQQGFQDDTSMLVKEWLETKHTEPWLMVLDNVDDKVAYFIDKMRNGNTTSEMVPRCKQGSLLFTTRTIDLAVDLIPPAEPIVVTAMTEDEGAQLVRKRLPGENTDPTVLAEFLSELDYIPLAIAQAVAFIAKRRKTVTQYLQQYRSDEMAKMRMLNYEFSGHGRQDRLLESIAKTWAISFNWIRNNDKRAIELLYVVSFLQYQSIPKTCLLGHDEDEFDFEDAIATLKGFLFLEANTDDTMFKTHRLVQLTTRSWLQTQSVDDMDKWALIALTSVASSFPEPDPHPVDNYFATCASMLPHAELMLQYKFQKPLGRDGELVRAKLLDYTGRYVYWISDYQTGRTRFQEAYEIKKKYLGEKDVERLSTQGRLLWSYLMPGHDQGLEQAVDFGYQLLELRREVLGEDDPDTIDCLSDLGGILEANGEYAKSRELQEEAVERSVRVLGAQHQDTLNCKAHLASVLQDLGFIQDAVEMQREVYDGKRKVLGPENPDVLVAAHNLGLMLSDANEVDEALQLTRQTFETKRRVLGADHRETLVTGHLLAVELRNHDKVDEARELCMSIVAEARLGPRRNNEHCIRMVDHIEDYLRSWA